MLSFNPLRLCRCRFTFSNSVCSIEPLTDCRKKRTRPRKKSGVWLVHGLWQLLYNYSTQSGRNSRQVNLSEKKIESHKTICTILNGSTNNRVLAAVWIKFNRHWLCVTERYLTLFLPNKKGLRILNRPPIRLSEFTQKFNCCFSHPKNFKASNFMNGSDKIIFCTVRHIDSYEKIE